jgi:hypothetical protein
MRLLSSYRKIRDHDGSRAVTVTRRLEQSLHVPLVDIEISRYRWLMFDHACAVFVAHYSPLELARNFDRVCAVLVRYIVGLIDYFIGHLTIASRGTISEVSACG